MAETDDERLKGPGWKAVPFSPNSASSTTAETLSTSEATTPPAIENTSPVARMGRSSTSSPMSLLGAFVDVSQPPTALTSEASFSPKSKKKDEPVVGSQFTSAASGVDPASESDLVARARANLKPESGDQKIATKGKNLGKDIAYETDNEDEDSGNDCCFSCPMM